MNIPEIEQKILKNWRSIKAFERSVEERPQNRKFVFYEGPPTANGMPHPGHILTRCFKDVICRYKTMRGFRVERRAGWDTHGLPVEIEVEKNLGLKNKKDIEKYGIAKFNKKCKESVWKYKKAWEEMTERIGFWIDMENPYITYDPLYMESLWWIIDRAHKKDLLYEGHKVVPYCPRCGTGLSSHEVALGYQDVTETSVYIKFKIKNPNIENVQDNENVYLLAWTTTPWTLPGNVALAVGEKIQYQIVRTKEEGEVYVLASELTEDVLGAEAEYEVLGTVSGKDLAGIEYEPLFDIKELKTETSYKVYPAEFVSTEEGTGVVHTAVMYGEDDYNLGDKLNLPKKHTVSEEGKFNNLVPEFEGQFVKGAEDAIVDRLKAENKLYKAKDYEHSYPFCWRCDTPLLYYARNSWFMAMSKLREDLVSANKKINWVPDYLQEGRFGEWLREVKDWAFSRSRYWATPLPVWKCNKCDAQEIVGSRDRLAELTKGKNQYYIMRHGQAETNIKEIIVSDFSKISPHDKLTPKGIKEVQEAARKLKKEGGIDVIETSPLGRTTQTAEIIAKELGAKVELNELLREKGLGTYEAKTEQEYLDYFKGEEGYNFEKTTPEGETPAQIRVRMLEAIRQIEKKYEGKKVLILTHRHPFWALDTTLRGFTLDESVEWRKENYPSTAEFRRVEYASFPYNDEGELDLHRPYIDEIKFGCTECKDGQMQRVEDLVDVWYDSGSMPFAQQNYPFSNKEKIEKGEAFPADYIVEGIDQTRGWFYTMHAVSAILQKAPAYKNVISLGLVLAEDGKKLSKSKKNYADPMIMAEKYGIDSLRWYFFTVNHPGSPKRLAEEDIKERWQKFIGTFVNSYTFLKTYSPDIKPPKSFTSNTSSNILDKWIIAKLNKLGYLVTKNLDEYNTLEAARALDSFVMDDLSNWYVRRSRDRIARPNTKKEKQEAEKTLSFVLSELAKLAAPFVPFVTEHIWQEVNKTEQDSVHWELLPNYKKPTKTEGKLITEMDKVREYSQQGLALRAKAHLKVRQPLQAFAVDADLQEGYKDVLKSELNVKGVVSTSDVSGADGWMFSEDKKTALQTTISKALEIEGQAREFIRHIQKLRKALGLNPRDKVVVEYSMPPELRSALVEWEKRIASDTNAESVTEKQIHKNGSDAEVSFSWDSKNEVTISIKKV